MNPFGPDPLAFFGSAAGPRASDLLGPPNGVLDLYVDGTPMADAQTAANGAITAANGPWYARKDVHALAALAIGAVMVHLATR